MSHSESNSHSDSHTKHPGKTCPPYPLRPRRKITGMSAILLPLCSNGDIDWIGFRNHVEKTTSAGLVPAINMDTGYANLITEEIRIRALDEAKTVLNSAPFVAGVFVSDSPDSPFDAEAYRRGIKPITQRGGLPIFFQSFGLVSQSDAQIAEAYQTLAKDVDRFLAFELGSMVCARSTACELSEQRWRARLRRAPTVQRCSGCVCSHVCGNSDSRDAPRGI